LGVVGIAGSLRQGSWNLKLLKLAMDAVRKQGVEAEEFDLTPVPLYSPALEVGGELPASVRELRDSIAGADAVVLTAPEYNSTIPAVMKNVVEWACRAPNVIPGQVFYVMGCTPGRSGSIRMAEHLVSSIESEGGWVVTTPRVLLPHVDQAISPEGAIIDASVGELLDQAMATVLDTARRLKA
jgi:chromate reductase